MTIATFVLIAIALVVVVGVVATLAALTRDGYHRTPNAPILRNSDDRGWR